MQEIGVVVINYDSGPHLRNCLDSLPEAAAAAAADFIVVDNASRDDSLAGVPDHPDVKVFENARNLGYGSACNKGFAETSAEFVCFLNPDVVPEAGSLAAMAVAMAQRPEVGVLGPRLNNPDGSRYPSCRVVPSLSVAVGHAVFGLFTPNNRFSRAYMLLDREHDDPEEVEWVSGAAMMVRRDAFEQVGGFDESYFMYVEDVDLCNRLRAAGWKALYFPEAVMMHHVAGSSRRTPYRMIFHHHRSLLRYALARARGVRRLAAPLLVVAVAGRLLVAWVIFFLKHGRRMRRDERPVVTPADPA